MPSNENSCGAAHEIRYWIGCSNIQSLQLRITENHTNDGVAETLCNDLDTLTSCNISGHGVPAGALTAGGKNSAERADGLADATTADTVAVGGPSGADARKGPWIKAFGAEFLGHNILK
jgi:hypothetical protein